MNLRTATLLLALASAGARCADATTPFDPAQRNQPFAPVSGAAPESSAPAEKLNSRVQESRVAPPSVDRKESNLGSRRAPVETSEAREKSMVEKNIRTPEAIRPKMSRLDHQPSSRSTAEETRRPPMVARFQDSLEAASAGNMARFPALNGATTAKINRFVFRKNNVEPDRVLSDAPVTPAAGGGAVSR